MKVGDRVRLVKIHHRMNPNLKTHLGEEATVRSIGHDGFVLVKFDRTDVCYGKYWINPKNLADCDGAEK